MNRLRELTKTSPGLAAALLILLLAGAGRAQDEEESDTPEPTFPDQHAVVDRYSIERDDDELLVRVTFHLTYPKASVHSAFIGQATFEVVIPNASPAVRLPRRIAIAEEGVADVLLMVPPDARETRIQMRLNTPVRCRAYTIPAKQVVVVEAAFPEDHTVPPPPAPEDAKQALITAEFVETDIRIIVETLATETGANILIEPGLAGEYTLSLRDVTLSQALDALWAAWRIVWVELPSKIILLGSESDLGDRMVEQDLELPEGWNADAVWSELRREFHQLRLARSEQLIILDGPLPVWGPVRVINQARQRLARLPVPPEGYETLQPTTDTATDSLLYQPRHVSVEIVKSAIEARYRDRGLRFTSDETTLLVEGPIDLINQLRTQILPTIDRSAPTPPRPEVRIYQPQHLAPDIAEQAIKSLYPDVTITVLGGGRTLLLQGTASDLEELFTKHLAAIDIELQPESEREEVIDFGRMAADTARQLVEVSGGTVVSSVTDRNRTYLRVKGTGTVLTSLREKAAEQQELARKEAEANARPVSTPASETPPRFSVEADRLTLQLVVAAVSPAALDWLGLGQSRAADELVTRVDSAGFRFAHTPVSLSGVLRRLEQDDRTLVTTTRRMTAAPGAMSEVRIKDGVTLLTATRADRSAAESGSAGLSLFVEPHHSSTGLVQLVLEPFVNLVRQSETGPRQTSRRTTEVTVRVSDGGTVALAGLLDPALAWTKDDLPGLADLLAWQANQPEPTELVILVSPQSAR